MYPHFGRPTADNSRNNYANHGFQRNWGFRILNLVTVERFDDFANASAVSELFGVKLAVGTDVDTIGGQQLMWVHVGTLLCTHLYSNRSN